MTRNKYNAAFTISSSASQTLSVEVEETGTLVWSALVEGAGVVSGRRPSALSPVPAASSSTAFTLS